MICFIIVFLVKVSPYLGPRNINMIALNKPSPMFDVRVKLHKIGGVSCWCRWRAAPAAASGPVWS